MVFGINNASYDITAVAVGGDDAGTDGVQVSSYGQCFVNCTNTSNVKVKFGFTGGGSDQHLKGSSTVNETYATFKRLADT